MSVTAIKRTQMNRKTCRTKPRPKVQVDGTLHRTKRLFHKTFRNIKSFLLRGYRKLLRNPFPSSIFSAGNKVVGPKLQEVDNFHRRFPQQWDSNEVLSKKAHNQCRKSSIGVSDQRRLEDIKQKKAKNYSGRKEEEPSFLATENFARKMEELEMLDKNNGDHVQDIEEAVHNYSLLTSPAYLEIVDKFFMDVYLELNLTRPSRSVNSSMRKLGSDSIHGSMRKPGSASVYGSMRKPSSASVNGSMRKPGSASFHGSMRKLDSASVHGSMRKLYAASVHGSMRKLDSARVHGSMRKLDSVSIHGSMRKLDAASVHCSMRSLGRLKL